MARLVVPNTLVIPEDTLDTVLRQLMQYGTRQQCVQALTWGHVFGYVMRIEEMKGTGYSRGLLIFVPGDLWPSDVKA